METEKDTKQTLPDHVLEYIATIFAFDALFDTLLDAVERATRVKKEKSVVRYLSNMIGGVWFRVLFANNLEEYAYNDRDQVDLEGIASVLASDETTKEFIDVGISTYQNAIEETFVDIYENLCSRFSQIVELIGRDTYSSTLSVDLEEYDVTVTVLTCGLLMRSYLEVMKEKFYGESEYPEDFLDVQKETWKGLCWLKDSQHDFTSEAIRQLAIM